MKAIEQLIERNHLWSEAHRAADPEFFQHLSEIQRPDYLWIGCADSRVPANEIVGMAPGELFVHRNVANIVVPGDPNCMSAVQYAIEVLEVRHIIVCGHYGCGGVRAALDNEYGGAAHVERWLVPLRELAVQHQAELALRDTDVQRWDRLCELNVVEQVRRLLLSDVLVRAQLRGLPIAVYGMIYGLRDGILRELIIVD
jgi:carbonic anhydrase